MPISAGPPNIFQALKIRHFEVSNSDFITNNGGLNLFTKQQWVDSETYWAYSAAHIFGLSLAVSGSKLLRKRDGYNNLNQIHMGKTVPVSIDIVHMTCIYIYTHLPVK